MKTIHVSTKSGSDLPPNDGSFNLPFKTIGHASDFAKTDPTVDTIQIGSGTYHETVIPQRDGLTYNGERGPNGEWLTIIDPSLPVDPHKWAPVTDAWAIGASVWQAQLGYKPGIFIYDGKCIECVGTQPSIDPPFSTSLRGKDRLKILTKPYDPNNAHAGAVKSGGTLLHDVRFWDGPYALAAYDNDPKAEEHKPGSGITYIRFRDNSRPPNLTLRAASISVPNFKWTYGIYIAGNSNTTITNLAIQGAYVGLRIASGHNNIVKNCQIQHGLHRILMEGDPASTIVPHDNEISSNTFRLNMYGYATPGAYPTDKANATDNLALKEWFYTFLKYVVGDSSTADIAIKMGVCGANNRIHHNIFENGAEGVFTYLCDNTQIYSNTFRQLSDCGVLSSDAAQKDYPSLPSGETVQSNTFTDVFQFMRYDSIDKSGGVRRNFHYFLSNGGENDRNLGMIVQFHMADYSPSRVAMFALTMAGNRFGLTAAVFHFSAYTAAQGGIPEVTISGNTFLSPSTLVYGGNDEDLFLGKKAMVGSFVNNRLLDDMGKPAWYGDGNTVI
jgi:hypothetical protein